MVGILKNGNAPTTPVPTNLENPTNGSLPTGILEEPEEEEKEEQAYDKIDNAKLNRRSIPLMPGVRG